MDIDSLRSELETLLNDLARREAAEKASPGDAGSTDATSSTIGEKIDEYSDALRKLSEYLTTKVDDAEEAVTTHPFVAISAAFMLGIAVGRISRL